jgi:GT2 family glycosyltransferase
MKNCPKVFVIVLNYNGKETIKSCLLSVYQSDYPNYELVVVDNDSKDGSLELAKLYLANAHFIKNEANVGFAAGNNVAIRFALEKFADYIFLLNNDATIKKDTILRLVEAAESSEKTGIIGPVIYRPDGSVWYAGGQVDWFKMRATHAFDIKKQSPYETDFVSGCAMLAKKEVFRKIGLLDEKYFLYYEDADFCQRAGKNGFKCLVVPDVKTQHFEKSENNFKNKTYWLVISGLIFFKKHTPMFLRPWMNFYLILRKVKNWTDVKFKKNDISLAVQKAHREYKNIG